MDKELDMHHGFRRITPQNWQTPDVPRMFPRMTEKTWLSALLSPQLDMRVPEEARKLFEVARGSLVYGWHFYPLITLASEQLHRVAETSVRMRCDLAGIPTKQTRKNGTTRETSFDQNIRELTKAGIITSTDSRRWQATRKLRNITSHPSSQFILHPAAALRGLKATTVGINNLYR